MMPPFFFLGLGFYLFFFFEALYVGVKEKKTPDPPYWGDLGSQMGQEGRLGVGLSSCVHFIVNDCETKEDYPQVVIRVA